MNILKMLSLLVIFTNCGGVSHQSEELGNGYVHSNRGVNLKEIYSPSDSIRNIYGKIKAYAYNHRFVIAIQQPDREVFRGSIGFELRNKNRDKYAENSENDMKESERVADSLMRNDMYYQKIFSHKLNYWIISHKHRKMYGPLIRKEYLSKRKELGVPNELQFEGEND